LLLLSRAGPGRAGPGLNFDGQVRAGPTKKRSYRAGPGRNFAGSGRAEKFRPVQDSTIDVIGPAARGADAHANPLHRVANDTA